MTGRELELAAAAGVWGSLPGWLALVGMAGLALILVRGGAGQAVEGLQATNRELQRQINELQAQVRALTAENAELRGRTDVAAVIRPVLEAVRSHELNAARRSDRMIDILDLIAQRLGREPNHASEAGL